MKVRGGGTGRKAKGEHPLSGIERRGCVVADEK